MRRREFIGLLGGAAMLACPDEGQAQQGEKRRLAVLVASAAQDPDIQERLAAFRQALARRGWSDDRIQMELRFGGSRPDEYGALANELFASKPEVILAHTTGVAVAAHRQNPAVPMVFVSVSDPEGSGLVASLAHPGGNATGMLQFEAGITGKWLAMLKEIAPRLTHVALLGSPKTTPYEFFARAAEASAAALGIAPVRAVVENAAEIRGAIEACARMSNCGLVLPPDSTTVLHRDLIVALANENRVPAVYGLRIFVAAGGLMSYTTDQPELFRQAAFYVDRILRGDKAADLPVQAPTKYETVLNLKAAKAIGLDAPPSLLVRADEVIE
jgi:putative tryptophan/tyrosine transport system substrate-binding protein